jgi:hypothetical protein
MRKDPGVSPDDVLAAVTTISFDIAGLELYLPLLVGARIEMIQQETATDGELLKVRLEQSGATVMQATPTTWRQLVEAGWNGGGVSRAMRGRACPAMAGMCCAGSGSCGTCRPDRDDNLVDSPGSKAAPAHLHWPAHHQYGHHS